MKKRIILLAFAIIIFIPFIYADNNYSLSEQKINTFVNKMIDTYNLRVISYVQNSPEYFPLYHNIGDSFYVKVIKPDQNNNDCLYLLFIPIKENNPLVYLSNETYYDYFNGLIPKDKLCKITLSSETPQDSISTSFDYTNKHDLESVPYNFFVSTYSINSDLDNYSYYLGSSMANRDIQKVHSSIMYFIKNNFIISISNWLQSLFGGYVFLITFLTGLLTMKFWNKIKSWRPFKKKQTEKTKN
jgi:hypothetical protein